MELDFLIMPPSLPHLEKVNAGKQPPLTLGRGSMLSNCPEIQQIMEIIGRTQIHFLPSNPPSPGIVVIE